MTFQPQLQAFPIRYGKACSMGGLVSFYFQIMTLNNKITALF